MANNVNVKKLEADLWESADLLRAGSKLTSNQYCMPVLGLIFLRYAYSRFKLVEQEILKDRPMRGGRVLPVEQSDFAEKSALFLPKESQYNYLVNLPANIPEQGLTGIEGNPLNSLGEVVNNAMELVEQQSEQLQGVLPKDYTIFSDELLGELLRMEQLLIVEDDIGLNQGLCKALKADDRQIISCHDLKAAREQLLCGSVSLVLLDINLPDGSGLELLREIKENTPGIPVILLTANDTDLDIVDGLERGADDYITKPFSLSVLRARVNTQLRKQASNHKNAPFHMDLFHFDFEAMTFYVADSKVELSKTEQKLLRLLVENRGRTMTRGDLVDRIWTDGAEYVDENALSVTIKRLRDKLGAQKYIKTVYGIGYSWVTKDE